MRVDIGPDESKEGRMRVFSRLVGKDNLQTNIHRPIYHFTLGKYNVRFYIWGELLESWEIEFFQEQDDFDRLLDEFIRAKKAEFD